MPRWILAGLLMSLTLVLNSQAATYHVPDDYPDIQSALNSVNTGDEVIVRDGTWTGDGNRDLDFLGKDIVLKSENGPAACVLDAGADEFDHHRVFWLRGGETRDAVIEGFTITGGYMMHWESPGNEGGGILLTNDSSPTIRNCVIENNTAKHGGGILANHGDAYVQECVIRNNTATSGSGGGVYLMQMSGGMNDCEIRENQAVRGGGVMASMGTVNLTNCRILGNVAAESGGGVYWNSYGFLRFCTISSNEAGHGGGVDMRRSQFEIYKCTITGNRAVGGLGTGGGIRFHDVDLSGAGYSIVWGNSTEDPEYGKQIAVTGSSSYMRADIDHSVVQGGAADMYFQGNGSVLWGDYASDEDPQFCSSDPDAEEFWMLQSDSPCYNHIYGQIGAWASGCDAVTTLLQHFAATDEGDGIRLEWNVLEPAQGEFELIGSRGNERWRVEYVALGNGSYRALDHNFEAWLGGLLRYELSYRRGREEWLPLGETTIHAGAPHAGEELRVSPNPFNPTAVLRFSLRESERVLLQVLDLRGRVVNTLEDRVHAAGPHEFRWDGTGAGGAPVASGVYLIRLEVAGRLQQQKVALVR